MSKWRNAVAFALVLFLSVVGSAQIGSTRLNAMHLLTADVGWATAEHQLLWTTDGGGQWEDITPRMAPNEEISSVFFLDGSTGWVLLSGEGAGEGPRFDLASTSNAGAAWSVNRIRIPRLDPESITLAGGGRINFVDPLHGWINLNVVSSSNFRLGLTLGTEDGGLSWHRLQGDPGIAGSIRFVNPQDGWLVGGPADQDVYGTHDSGRSWRQLSLQAPEQVHPATYPTYSLPVFENTENGYLPVTYSGPHGAHSALVLFTTNDAGRTWRAQSILSNLEARSPGQKSPSVMADSVLVTAAMQNHTQLTVTTVTSDSTNTATAEVLSRDSAILDLSFVDKSQGWSLSGDGRLRLTRNGGISWSDITPLGTLATTTPSVGNYYYSQNESTTSDASPLLSSAPATLEPAIAVLGSNAHISRHLGFDAACAPLDTLMETWWTYSPYFDVGVYIGGINQHRCAPKPSPPNPNLTPGWIFNVAKQGWGIMPLWVGPQASGTSFGSTPSAAQAQGVKQATMAAAAANSLGLLGTIIYYDLEQYSSSKFGPVATAFINGWVSKLHSLGYLAGVYGAPSNAQSDWKTSSPLPDDVWITYPGANSAIAPRISIWGLATLCDPLLPTSGCTLWLDQERIKQYLIGQTGATFHGTAPLEIDNDVEDAKVAGGEISKTYTYCATLICYISFDLGGGTFTHFHSINDVGQAVGVYIDASGANHGFLYSGGNFTNVDCGITATWTPEAINNAGQIVGYDSDSKGHTHGFLTTAAGGCQALPGYAGAAAGGTSARGINDAGWISGTFATHISSTTQQLGYLYYTSIANFFPSPINFFGADGTSFAKINGLGRTAGWGPGSSTSFVGTGTCSTCFTKLPAIGAGSNAITISNNDHVAGTFAYAATGPAQGFVYDYDSEEYTVIAYPGTSMGTEARSVNASGKVVGWYTDSVGDHAFMACPQPQFSLCIQQ
jgi:probable HAF family extracellular repeat protein